MRGRQLGARAMAIWRNTVNTGLAVGTLIVYGWDFLQRHFRWSQRAHVYLQRKGVNSEWEY